MKKYQVFISSTYEDLQEERKAIVEAILIAGHIPAGMELFSGAGTSIKIIKRWINESDIYVLLLGGRYGSIYEESSDDFDGKISYTEWEYEYAKSLGKPICVIVLSEKMIYGNAQKYGGDKIIEKDNVQKYERFKNKVIRDGFCKQIENLSEISGIVQADINAIICSGEYNLLGWIKADQAAIDIPNVRNDLLIDIFQQSMDTYISRYYKDVDVSDFSKMVGIKTRQVVNAEGLLDSFHRIVRIFRHNDTLIKVVIADEYVYRYLDSKHHAFGKRFHATRQQAESYKVEKLLINHIDYSDDFELNVSEDTSRGQLSFCVESKKSVPLGNDFPVDIYYVSSYLCQVSEFFQAFGLPFPCKNFMVDIYLEDDLEKKYSIVTSTNSLFSKVYSDSFKANEMKNFIGCSIRLPEWALASDGYVATLKEK